MTEDNLLKACKQYINTEKPYVKYDTMVLPQLKLERAFIDPEAAIIDYGATIYRRSLKGRSFVQRLKFCFKLLFQRGKL